MNTVKMNILGVELDCLSYEDMYPIYDSWLVAKNFRSHSLALINVNCCISALFDKKLRDIYNSVDIIGIDSTPFLKWARLFYNKKSGLFCARELMLEIGSKAKQKNYSFFLYGGFPDALDKIENYLREHFEGINIVGKYSPPFRPLTGKEDQEICTMINRAKPDFLWIGLGSPKQDIWIHDHLHKIRRSVMIPSGAIFDFFGGRIKEAPKFIRNLGFEWLFRLTQDFKRLWIRYTVYNIIFIILFILQQMRILEFKISKKTDYGNGK